MRWLLIASLSCCASTGAAPASAAPAPVAPWLRTFYEGRAAHRDPTALYSVSFADLDGDGRKEALVYVSGQTMCGSGGCSLFILAPRGRSWRLVTKTTITWPPIRLLPTRRHGWRDLGVRVRGGGILPGYEAVLSFDGRKYRSNPGTTPDRSKAGGRAVIGAGRPGSASIHERAGGGAETLVHVQAS